MKKLFKFLLFIIVSLFFAALVDVTFILQYLFITYSVTIILYFLSGVLINRKDFGSYTFLFLFPLFALNVFALIVNKLTFPIVSPITFILATFAFILGQIAKTKNIGNKNSLKFYSFLAATLFSFLFFSLYFTPNFLYNKNRGKISGVSNVYEKLDFSNLDGTSYQLNSLKHKTVLIDNWFLNCSQCILKLPYLQSLSDKASSDSTIKIITVINGKIDSIDKVNEFLLRHPEIKLPVLYDKFNSIKNLIKIAGYPIEFIIDKDGFIKEWHDGFNKDERIIYVTETFKKLKAYNEK